MEIFNLTHYFLAIIISEQRPLAGGKSHGSRNRMISLPSIPSIHLSHMYVHMYSPKKKKNCFACLLVTVVPSIVRKVVFGAVARGFFFFFGERKTWALKIQAFYFPLEKVHTCAFKWKKTVFVVVVLTPFSTISLCVHSRKDIIVSP